MDNFAWTVHQRPMNAEPKRLMSGVRSLSIQFLLAGGLVMVIAAYTVGTWVADRIEQGVVRSSGASAALYIESLIPNQTIGIPISEDARLALRQVFNEGILSERVITYNIWSEKGVILDSNRPEQRGQKFEPSEALLSAWSGEVASEFQALKVQADHPGATVGVPLLEVYVPIRDATTGEVVFVVEFYQRAEDLAKALASARLDSWILVLSIFGLSGVLLFFIVHSVSRLINRQRKQLQSQLTESRKISLNNEALRKRVSQAAQRSTAQSEKIMQRIGQDLHDGVAQHLSLASLRLESAGLGPSKDADIVMQALASAMKELRGISRGLSLPDLALLDLKGCARQAVDDHNKSFGSDAKLSIKQPGTFDTSYATKLCVYRFLQESLSNASRHAHATEIVVELTLDNSRIEVVVSDNGRGFDVNAPVEMRDDGGQGLLGLADRAATLGGEIETNSNPGMGTKICLRLPIAED